jgi:hypothetical protein
MRAYSEDLRKKIVAAIERGMSKAQVLLETDVKERPSATIGQRRRLLWST